MLKNDYKLKKDEIKKRLIDFSNIKGNELFYELCFCLLTPGSSALICDEKVKKLKEADFLNKNVDPKKLIYPVRFFNNKARNLLEAKGRFNDVKKNLNKEPRELREFLVKNIRGLAYKESTHYIRNIGKGDGLAILDRHILKNLKKLKIIKEVPKTMTRKRYLDIENEMIKFSEKVKIPVEELDLLFWSKETGFVFK